MSSSFKCSTSHVIIAGFGVPGRVVADLLETRGLPFCVIELNPSTCERCQRGGVPIVAGDVTDPQVLKNAGIEHAAVFVVAIPDEKAALLATHHARELNPTIRIITRCHFISAGLEAKRRGADEVVIAEQVVATELAAVVSNKLSEVDRPASEPAT
jgi:CPA2 family monovalent cation:H+ antiporter-2